MEEPAVTSWIRHRTWAVGFGQYPCDALRACWLVALETLEYNRGWGCEA